MRFTLSGNSSVLEIFPHIDLSDSQYEIGLSSLITYNSIPNIESGKNDKFYYGDNKSITLPEGTYEVTSIEESVNNLVKDANFNFKLRPNNITMHTEIFCTHPVDFTKANTFGNLLGFAATVLEKNRWHTSPQTANIYPVHIVRVICNIAHRSYWNTDEESHAIYDFFPTVDAGFKITEKPAEVTYLPVNAKYLTNITVRLEDQDGKLVNFRKEIISITLQLRKSKEWD